MTQTLCDKHVIEAAIFSSAEPLPTSKLKLLLSSDVDIKSILVELQEDYQERGIELKKVASGWRFQVCEAAAKPVAQLREKNPPRYTRALLETLVLIAYRQPITRGEIEQVRGVAVSSHIIRTLQDRDWIKIAGHRDAPGKPALFATTPDFLDYFNLANLSELPALAEICDISKAEEKLTEELSLLVSPNVAELEEVAAES